MDKKTQALINKIRSNYDALAQAYAREVAGELDHRPLERDLLQRFAKECGGLVCDLGCGPGHVARYVSDFNPRVFGLDLSAGILQEARARHPEIIFVAGNILELPLAAGKLAGIIASYSIIHFDQQQVSQAFQEMYRALRPGGHLLIGVHLGREVVHADELWGVPVDFDAVFFDLKELGGKLESFGFKICETVQRGPIPEVEYQSTRGYIWAERHCS
ncbi:MAG TPA: class I SAM-dependent methyltransferase [Candidatus Angelobacter sp.]|jgi:SAM-dependent methyltransferase